MYKLTNNEKIVQRLSDNAFIPFDKKNGHYIRYLQWLAEGNTPEPADELAAEQLSTQDQALALLLKSVKVADEDAALKDELLTKLNTTEGVINEKV